MIPNLQQLFCVIRRGGVAMFVRFVVPVRDEESRCLTGVFQAAFDLGDRGLLDTHELRRFDAIREWFNLRLPAPDRFARSRGRQAHRRAVCWFKADALEHLGKVRELTALLGRHGVQVRRLRSARPGYVLYEDEYQVAAVPFRDVEA
jgi:hypothetical protein